MFPKRMIKQIWQNVTLVNMCEGYMEVLCTILEISLSFKLLQDKKLIKWEEVTVFSYFFCKNWLHLSYV